jgi:hypothetical protein
MRLAVLLAALLAFPAFAAEPVPLPQNEMIDWSGEGGEAQVFTSDDLTLTLTITGDDAERIATLVAANASDAREVTGISAGTGYGQLGVFPFDDNGLRSVIFGVYSGGAHCCTTFYALTEQAGDLVTGEIGTVDGDGSIEDLDGDGVFEMPLWDSRFGYAFDAFAFAYPPHLIKKSRDGVPYDASADPRFKPYFASELEAARGSCGGETWDLGACAGLLGMAARLGTFETELATIQAALASGKKTSGWDEFEICLNDDCSEKYTSTDFGEAIAVALSAWGYLPPR